MICQCSADCEKEVIGRGKYAKGHNPSSHDFKYTEEYHDMMVKRNKSWKMRCITSATNYARTDELSEMCIKRNKTKKMRKAVSNARKRFWRKHRTKAIHRLSKAWVSSAKRMRRKWRDKNFKEKVSNKISKALRAACALGKFVPHHGQFSIIVKTRKGDIKCRCGWEARFCKALDTSSVVKNFWYEPFRIPYKDIDGKERTFIPDFAFTLKNGRTIVFEIVGYELHFHGSRDKIKLKDYAAECFCTSKGFEYVSCTKWSEVEEFCRDVLCIDIKKMSKSEKKRRVLICGS